MKKLLLFVCLMGLTSWCVNAQKGSMYIGGGAGYNDVGWTFAPEVGTWLGDDLQLGLVLGVRGYDERLTQLKYSVSPHFYLRKWKSVSDKFSLYVGLNARPNLVVDFSDTGYTNIDVFLDAGFAFAIAPRWGMVGRVASLGYIRESFDLDINLSPSSMFNVGLYYTFLE